MPYNFFKKLLGLILPPRRTERTVGRLTPDELLTLQTAEGLPYAHEDVRSLVWELKYHASRRAAALAGKLIAEELLAIASEELGRPLLVPVPMHKARRRERGHNQTELLCEAVLRHLGAPADFAGKIVWPAEQGSEDFFTGKSAGAYEYAPRALERTRPTLKQQKLNRTQRLRNVAGSMEADQRMARGRVCVVVDDVTTTGATLAEAKRALLAAGAARVHTLALAQS